VGVYPDGNETTVGQQTEVKNQNPNFQNENDGMTPVRSMTQAEIKQEKMRIWKNVAIISLSFMCLFTAFNSVGNLQVNYNYTYFLIGMRIT
jgi:hypothetical protein